MPDQPWGAAPLVAIGLEGTGPEDDDDDEAIMEIAILPLDRGHPDMGAAWSSLVNPGRWISPKPWIAPAFNGDVLASAPDLDSLRVTIAGMLNGRYLVGHNVEAAWRLLCLRLPGIKPAGLIDTTQLLRYLRPIERRTLLNLLTQYGLATRVSQLVPGGRPNRAMWDAAGAALLLGELVGLLPNATHITLDVLTGVAGVRLPAKLATLDR